MIKDNYNFDFTVYDNSDDLNIADAQLLADARKATELAYAPYSDFHVGAVAMLINGETVKGSNQENASYPVGICAERVLLSTASSLFPHVAVDTIAISYKNNNGESGRPISPCGMCRQALAEYEERNKRSMRLILSGMEGKVIIIEKASDLLPLSFGSTDLK